ncbi:MAG: FtsX-like permease family protein [Prolixibacteraceae bacterium]|jgi:ABC-type lipoprotein release transport system permease subunit|nr:FtsX-like permease family protein [Prolixibacteraceae bacterium]
MKQENNRRFFFFPPGEGLREASKLAWRNLWRNKRRTLITVSSIFFGVLLSAYMTSMQEGSYEKMVDIVVKFYSGYIQVHHEDYWENKSINNTFEYDQVLIDQMMANRDVDFVIPRLESFGLASSEELTKGAIVFGIDPVPEDQLTGISEKITKGAYLVPDDHGVIIGEGLAGYLKLQLNDTLVMISQGFHGVSAAGKFPVRGIIKHVSPELNKTIVYMALPRCQEFFSAENRLTSLVVNVKDNDVMRRTLRNLKNNIQSPYSVMSWEEMQPEVVQQIESDRASGVIMKAILYLVIAFGVLGTIMMMIAERKREFGVMVSVGMRKGKLAAILLLETILIGLMGIVSGVLVALPLIWLQKSNPIPFTGQAAQMMEEFGFEPYMFFSSTPEVFYHQAISVFVLTMVIAVYPVVAAFRLKEIKALHS